MHTPLAEKNYSGCLLSPQQVLKQPKPNCSLVSSCKLRFGRTHQPISRRKSSRPTAVGWCVRNFTPTVGVISLINADSNVESAVGVNPHSALDKEVSGNNLAPLISHDESVGVCAQMGWCVQVCHNPMVGGKLTNKIS